MNFSTIALLAVAWLAIQNNGNTSNAQRDNKLKDILSTDANNFLDTLSVLNNKNSSKEDKTGAILQMVTNPAVLSMAGELFQGGIFGNKKNDSREEQSTHTDTSTNNNYQSTYSQDSSTNSQNNYNDEGYDMGNPSQEARNFFRPIENIAGIEASHKLYKLYDQWYSKKH